MTEEASNVIQFPTREELAKRLEGLQFNEYIFTNDKTNPYLQQILHAFYDGVLNNRLGVMHAKVAGTDTIATLLVGLVPSSDGTTGCYPLARILNDADTNEYLPPDGNGGWVGEEEDGEQTD